LRRYSDRDLKVVLSLSSPFISMVQKLENGFIGLFEYLLDMDLPSHAYMFLMDSSPLLMLWEPSLIKMHIKLSNL
jgi:hypothetical protein